METRALAIAFFYAIGTAVGGIVGPLLFGRMIATGARGDLAIAFVISAMVMALGGVAELFLGVKAAGKQLEDVAEPLSAGGEDSDTADSDTADSQDNATASSRQRSSRQGNHHDASQKLRQKFRPGVGVAASPSWGIAPPVRPATFRTEADAIARALDGRGPTDRREWGVLVGARRWGPGVFARALHVALAEGTIRRVGRSRFAVADGPDDGDDESRHDDRG